MVSYAESEAEDDEEEDVFKPVKPNKTRGRALKRKKTSEASDEEDFGQDIEAADEVVDEGNTIKAYLVIRIADIYWLIRRLHCARRFRRGCSYNKKEEAFISFYVKTTQDLPHCST